MLRILFGDNKKTSVQFIKLLITAFLLASTQIHATGINNAGMTHEQQMQVRESGKNVLTAMRKFETSGSADEIKTQIQLVRKQLSNLLAPNSNLQQLKISDGDFTPANTQNTWKEANASKISSVNSEAQKLAELCTTEIDKRKPLEPSTWEIIKGYVGLSDAEKKTLQVKKYYEVTDSALSKLVTIQDEINQAIQLPDSERHQALMQIAKRLQVSKTYKKQTEQEDGLGVASTKLNKNVQQNQKSYTPTLSTRTTHKRKF